ncbi:MAG: CHAT domain-containing protein [Bacteroidota bacterium]
MNRYILALIVSWLWSICLLGQSEYATTINLDSLKTYDQSTLDSLVNDYYTQLDIKDTFDLMGLIKELTYGDHYRNINFDSIIQNSIDWNEATKNIDWKAAMGQFDWNEMLNAMCHSPDSAFSGSPLKIDLSNKMGMPNPMEFMSKVDISKCMQMDINNPATMQRMFRALDVPCLMNNMHLFMGDSLGGGGLPLEMLGKMQGQMPTNGTPNMDAMCQLADCMDLNIMMEDFDVGCLFEQADFNAIMKRWKLSDWITNLDSIKLTQGMDTLDNAFAGHPIIGLMDKDAISHHFSGAFEDFFNPRSVNIMNQNFYDRIFGDNWLPQKDQDIRNLLELSTPLWAKLYGDTPGMRYFSSVLWLFYEVQLAYAELDYPTALKQQILLKDIVIQIIQRDMLADMRRGESLPDFYSEQILWSMLSSVEQLTGNTLSELGQHTEALTHFETAISINESITKEIDPMAIERNYFQKEFTNEERPALLAEYQIDENVFYLSMDDLFDSKHPKVVTKFLETNDVDEALTAYRLLKDLLLELGPQNKVIPTYQVPNPAANRPYEFMFLRLLHQRMAAIMEEYEQTNDPKYPVYQSAPSNFDSYQQYQLTTFFHNNIGAYYFQLNNYELGLRHLSEAWNRLKNLKKLDYVIAGRAGFGTMETAHQNQLPVYVGLIANLAQVYLAQNKYQQAKDFLEEAKSHLKQNNNYPKLEQDLFDVYALEASIHLREKDWRAGKAKLERCAKIADEGDFLLRKFQVANYWGHYFNGQNEVDTALTYWLEARNIAVQANHTNALSAIHALIGRTYLRKEQPKLAMMHLDSCEVIASERGQYDVLNQLYTIKGNYYRQRQDFSQALTYYDQAIELIEDSLFQHTLSEGGRQLTIANSTAAYEGAIHAAIELGKDQQAFQYVQQFKARTLLDLLATSTLKSQQIPAALKAQKQDIAAEISIQSYLKSVYPDSQQIAQKLRQALSQLQVVNASIRAASPAYAQLLQPQLADATELREQLQTQQAFVEFLLGEKVYAFLLTKKGIAVLNLGSRKPIQNALQTFVATADDPQVYESVLLKKRWAKTTDTLYQKLLAPLLRHPFFAGSDELIIAPDNWLYTVPFEVLLAKVTAADSTQMLDSFTVRYTQSASTLTYYQQQTKRRNYTKDMLVVSKADFSEYGAFRNLKLLDTTIFKMPRTTFLLESQATLANLRQQSLSDYRYLYINTHGSLSPQPELSYLALTGNPLFVYQTFDLQLDNQLAILAACQTGRGTFQRGSGILGFTRGLQNAGVQSVIISLWPVDDRPTEAFFEQFFTLKAEGLSDKQALQAAKVAFSQSKLYEHPLYWGGFVLFGG